MSNSVWRNKSNCGNTLTKFLKPDQEMVTRLKFFDIFDNENVNSIYMKTHNFTTKSNDSHLKEKSKCNFR